MDTTSSPNLLVADGGCRSTQEAVPQGLTESASCKRRLRKSYEWVALNSQLWMTNMSNESVKTCDHVWGGGQTPTGLVFLRTRLKNPSHRVGGNGLRIFNNYATFGFLKTEPYLAKRGCRKQRLLQIFWKLQRMSYPMGKPSQPGWLWRRCFLAATADHGVCGVGVNRFFGKFPQKRGGISMKK